MTGNRTSIRKYARSGLTVRLWPFKAGIRIALSAIFGYSFCREFARLELFLTFAPTACHKLAAHS
jgi:hypothetical protein